MRISIHYIFARSITLFFFLCVAGNVFSQTIQKKIDSLLAALPAVKDDTSKVSLLCQVAVSYAQTEPAKGLVYGRKALDLSASLHNQHGTMNASMAIGRCYSLQGDRVVALKYFQDALTAARNNKDNLGIAKALVSVGHVYKTNHEFDKAIAYMQQAEQAYTLAGVKNMQSAISGIGNCYTEQGENDTALPYYLKAIAMEEADTHDPAALAILYNNVGGAYASINRFDSALIYLAKASAYIHETGNLRSAGYNFNNIGWAYMAMSRVHKGKSGPNLAMALNNEKRALDISYQLGVPDLRLPVLINLIDIYSGQGNYKDALISSQQLRVLQDSFYNIDHDRAFAKIEAEYKVKKVTDSLKYQNVAKDGELKQKRIERYMLIAFIIFIGIVAVMFMNRQLLKQKQQEEIARHQLEDFTLRIQEKNQLIEVITAEAERNKKLPDLQNTPIDHTLLTELQQSILLTDEQWDKFKDTFDKVYKGYFSRLRNRIPDLSPAEIRYITLSKLHLTPKEMGAMLGVGAQAMRVSKHRLIKKLGAEDDIALNNLIHTI
jgi:tetratricopeptide (TPR) repeat protein